MLSDPQSIGGVIAAAIGGLAVGIERQWSGHATGPHSHFAGIRTFALLGGLAGLGGWLWQHGAALPAAVLLGGAALLVVAAYVAASRRDTDGTTEVAALVVLAAGFLAGLQYVTLASAIVAITVLILVEKSSLHSAVQRISDEEIRAGARFAVMAVVILPLLPTGPYGPFDSIRPQALWAVVLLFAGLSFVGYVARRVVGAEWGYAAAGMLGGFISSTQVTIAHARASRTEPEAFHLALACGAVAASTTMFVRTWLAAAVLQPAVAWALLPYAGPGFAVGAMASSALLRRSRGRAHEPTTPSNPLQLKSALQMGVLFQIVLTAMAVVRERFGRRGLLVSGALIGATDVDAVTISMARGVTEGIAITTAAEAIAIAMLANTALKLVLAIAIGRGRFRTATAGGLLVLSATLAVALALTAR